ncbi:hypothetical protein [Streptomyces sp. 6N223]|uniref:hypothetical protein n=1 Tax=Streptomyces sp. 6N223 TaxID=3457412 RepID=UPI003FD1563E
MTDPGVPAVYRLVVCGDVKDSGRLALRAKLRMRESLYQVFQDALDVVGVGEEMVDMDDRGDGLLLAFSPEVPPALMAGAWLEEIRQGLLERNTWLRDPLRMRIAMHQGPVSHDGRGLVGRAVDLTCRLCDCEPARRILDAADGRDLVFVVSGAFHEAVIAQSEGERFVEPDSYRPSRVSVKETDEIAWFRVPGLPVPPDVAGDIVTGGGGTGLRSGSGGPGEGAGPPEPEGETREARAVAERTEEQAETNGAGAGAATFHIDVREGDSNVVSAHSITGGVTINNHGDSGRKRRRTRGE